MKISNETKVGALAAIAITLLILGFNFLKGRELFKRANKIYAVFRNVEGMEVSNTVRIKGLQIGTVAAINEKDADISGIVVTINLKKNVNIPKNSTAYISSGLISSSSIVITKGDATDFLANGDTIQTQDKPNLMSQVERNIDPIVARLNGTLESLDSLIEVVGQLFDPKLKNNFTSIFTHLAASSASMEKILSSENSALSRSLKNIDSFTVSLSRNSKNIDATLNNLRRTTDRLSNAKIDEAVASVQSTMNELKQVIAKINSSNGTLGLLINDKRLYQNLENTTKSLNILLDDLRLHPKRYVNVSVFGKKDKTGPLTEPLNDSTTKSGVK
ncbi:MAG: mammalian cell entry protein [Bacteroidetes bacterium]|nr:MAG: mammalian cell entry protein [Bacteroidota bacterium]